MSIKIVLVDKQILVRYGNTHLHILNKNLADINLDSKEFYKNKSHIFSTLHF